MINPQLTPVNRFIVGKIINSNLHKNVEILLEFQIDTYIKIRSAQSGPMKARKKPVLKNIIGNIRRKARQDDLKKSYFNANVKA